MIKSQEEKDYYESVVRGPHVYHWVYEVDPQTGKERLSCGQVYGNGTNVLEFVNCKKCLRVLDR